MAVPAMWTPLQTPRPPAGAELASPRRLRVSDDFARGAAALQLRGARRAGCQPAMGRERESLHCALRTLDDHVVAAGESKRRRSATRSFVGRSSRDSATRCQARLKATKDRVGARD